MDKYQEFILRQVYHNCSYYTEKDKWNKLVNGFDSQKTGRKNCGVFDFDKNVITIKQDEDILSTVYIYVIKKYYYESIYKCAFKRADFYCQSDVDNWATDYLDGVSVTRNGVDWEKLNEKGSLQDEYQLVLDFNDRVSKVKFSFVKGLADDYIMDVVYVESDKDSYYRKKAEEARRALIEKAKINVSTGVNLVNINFAPCCDKYDRAEIELYTHDNLMAKYNVPKELFFKSIDGLAYGTYSFILTQYDKDGKIIIQTNKKTFCIPKPRYGRLPDC